MKQHDVNELWNFIQGYYIDPAICDKLIDLHNSNPEKTPGKITFNNEDVINKEFKDSIDSTYYPADDRISHYIESLLKVTELYIESYPVCNEYDPFGLVEKINIQQYPINGGYSKFHTERAQATAPFSARHLVFMTYLNDVSSGGETEFLHQQLKIKPEKGLTLIWPTDWTFTHRGLPAETEKFVITGWLNFLN